MLIQCSSTNPDVAIYHELLFASPTLFAMLATTSLRDVAASVFLRITDIAHTFGVAASQPRSA